MPLPLQALNRLHLGGDLAAKVEATRADYSAWIYIEPLMDTSFQDARRRWALEGHY